MECYKPFYGIKISKTYKCMPYTPGWIQLLDGYGGLPLTLPRLASGETERTERPKTPLNI
ncbi:hypothetical protein M378DRAFT_156451, partial [Amanita muscaria Koide BX008]